LSDSLQATGYSNEKIGYVNFHFGNFRTENNNHMERLYFATLGKYKVSEINWIICRKNVMLVDLGLKLVVIAWILKRDLQ
jgi:hypothetical protein